MKSRIFILVVLATSSYSMVGGWNYVHAHQEHQAEERRLEEISERLGIPIEQLRPDHESLFDSLAKAFGVEPEDPIRKAGLDRLRKVLRDHEDLLANNPYRRQIEQIEREHAGQRLEGLVQDLIQLTETENGRALSESAQRALLRNLHHGLSQRPQLPPLPDGAPAKARGKQAEMQAKLDRLFDSVQSVVADAQESSLSGTLAQKTASLGRLQAVEARSPVRPPRFVDRPLPLRLVERKAPTREVSSDGPALAAKSPSLASAPGGPSHVNQAGLANKAEIAPEITALAASLGNSPARIFAWVHDNVEFDPKWGAFKGSLGTLWEKRGTSWDQAWLLRDLLVAAGVEARFEWGEIEISTAMLTNLTGLEDPFRAGDLLTTAGVPIVLLTQGSQVVAARLAHVWIKALVDYIPDRGATPGAGDTWILMDPSLKRFDYAAGLRVAEQVPFALSDYLLSGTPLSPRRAYEDALWSYIRANNIECSTLEQLKRAGAIRAESFPFLPGTLRGKILRVDGEATAVPDALKQRLKVEIRAADGVSLLSWETALPSLALARLELDWVGATADDQTILDANGGVFDTPPFLVDLRPVLRVGGIEQTSGASIGSAEEVEVFVTATPVNGPVDVLKHDGHAGEPSVILTDFGRLPRELLDRFQADQLAARAAGDGAAEEMATLQLIGATYMRELGRDLEDLTAWSWHRLVRLLTEGMVVQTGKVTTTVDGSPLSFTKEEVFVDVAAMIVGLFHAEGSTQFRRGALELAGSQGSFLEGEVFNQVVEREGIAAVSALTLAQREGQSLKRVDAANVEPTLATVDLGDDVENQVRTAVQQGRIAWIPETPVSVNLWQGTGYVLEDPNTGAAAYLLSGGFAGGADTGVFLERLQDLLGNEPWLTNGPFAPLIDFLLALLAGGTTAGDDGGPSTISGDPVNLSTGNFWHQETDILVQARGLPIVWTRTYNSRSDYVGPLGYGWTFSFGEHLVQQADGSVIYREDDGTEHLFLSSGVDQFDRPAGKHIELSAVIGGFELRQKDGLVRRFDDAGRLLSLIDRNGNTVSLAYDAAGNLSTIEDAAGRTVLRIETADGRITQIEDIAGRRVLYEYTGVDLTTATDTVGQPWVYAYDDRHNMIERRNPLGHADLFAFDVLDRCIRHQNPVGDVETFSYGSRGRRAVLTDFGGNSSFFEFDERGRATVQVDPLGNTRRSTWDADNNRLSTTDPRGGVISRSYDANGNLLSETNQLNQTTTFTYDPVFNRIATVTDASDHTVEYDYDTSGNLREVRQEIDGQTLVDRFSYDSFGQVLEMTNAAGATSTFTWDDLKGNLTSRTDAGDNSTTYTLDDRGMIVGIEDAETNLTLISWDGRDRIVTMTDPFDNTMTHVYDEAGRQVEVRTPRGVTLSEYDELGRTIALTDAEGNTTRTEYGPQSTITARIDALGNRTTMTYDAIGRLQSQIDALGHVWTFGFCAELGDVRPVGSSGTCAAGGCPSAPPGDSESFCELTDPLGNTTRQEHDALGRVSLIVDPSGHESEIEYDALGRRAAVTDALERRTRFEYTPLGRLSAVVEPDGSRTEYRYDQAGNPTVIRDAEGHEWTRTYNALNLIETEQDPLGNTTEFTYDALGNQETTLRPNGDLLTFTYDVRRLIGVTAPTDVVETLGNDSLGRRTSLVNDEVSLAYSYDALDRLTAITNNPLGQTLQFTYDGRGRRTTLSGPQGTVTFIYDAVGNLVEQRDPATGTYRFEYDAVGRRSRLIYPNGMVADSAYDAVGRLESVITRNAQGIVVDGYSYEFDAVGNRTAMNSLRSAEAHTYEYDDLNRLSRWERGADRFEEYAYDRVGNRLSLSDSSGTTSYAHDSANRLVTETRSLVGGGDTTTTYAHDENGNLLAKTNGSTTTSYTWDAFNRLRRIVENGIEHSYGYDPNGIRVRETIAGDTRRFLNGTAQIVGVFDGSNALRTYYSYGTEIDEPMAQIEDDELHYLHRDGLGSITALSTSGGQISGTQSYSPFGEIENSSGVESRFAFTGRDSDATGLMYYRSRYYAPDLGRFISSDVFRGVEEIPASLHRYAYAHNNPVNITDPTGQSTFAILLGMIAIAFVATFLIQKNPAMRAHFFVGFFATIAGFGGLVLLLAVVTRNPVATFFSAQALLLAFAVSVIIGIILEVNVTGTPHVPSQIIQSWGALLAVLLIYLLISPVSPVAKVFGSVVSALVLIAVGLLGVVVGVSCYSNRSCFGWN